MSYCFDVALVVAKRVARGRERRTEELLSLGFDGEKKSVEGIAKQRTTLGEEPVRDFLERDAERVEFGEDGLGLGLERLGIAAEGVAYCAFFAECGERCVGQRVHRVVANQLVDVERLRERRVLGSRTRPENALGIGAGRGELLPTIAREGFEETSVGELGIGDGDFGLQCRQSHSAIFAGLLFECDIDLLTDRGVDS